MANAQPLILVVDDDVVIRRFLEATLPGQGYRVASAINGSEAISQAAANPPHVILLDLGLPDFDGIEVMARLREWSVVPVLVISIRGHEEDKVRALDAGADDYVTKPFSMPELLARIRAALRRANQTNGGASQPVVDIGNIKVDLAARRVSRATQDIRLTPIEFKLLSSLVRHAGQVVTHEKILKEVWGPQYGTETNYLRVYIKQLRDKLETDPANPRHLMTEPGIGYRLLTE